LILHGTIAIWFNIATQEQAEEREKELQQHRHSLPSLSPSKVPPKKTTN
jgi:hypothetical protein